MKASELLREAADLIREHGWLQGIYGDPERGFCADGAMTWVDRHLAIHLPSALADGRHYFLKVIGTLDRYMSIEGQVIHWNDEKGRTKRQVLAKFKKAIELAESEGR